VRLCMLRWLPRLMGGWCEKLALHMACMAWMYRLLLRVYCHVAAASDLECLRPSSAADELAALGTVKNAMQLLCG
jgi:hypothetical protein